MRRLLLLLTLLTALPLIAQKESQTPTRERGIKPNQLYDFSQFDTINLFNGNLNLSIPIGSPFPVAEGLSYQFNVHYSGNVWTTREHCTQTQRETGNCGIWYTPQRDNAGLGWRLSFGELREPLLGNTMQIGSPNRRWQYTSPDGSEHLFYETLHAPKCAAGDTANCDEAREGFRYTRDGTYIRMRPGAGGAQVLEFGDGRRERYIYLAADDEWRLEFIYTASSPLDANGRPTASYVYFDYLDANSDGIQDWLIADSHGRAHYVYFRDGGEIDVVDKVVVAAFPQTGETNENATATYELSYGAYTVDANGNYVDGPHTSLLKPCEDQFITSTNVLLLTRVGMPDTSAFGFTYRQPAQACTGSLTERSDAGALETATLPTRGVLQWSYQRYQYSTLNGDQYANGVKEKIVKDAGGTELQKSVYTPFSNRVQVDTCRTWSAGTCTPETRAVSYFSAVMGASLGLPFVTSQTDGAGRYLSTELFSCNPTCGATPVKRTYVRYEFDQLPAYADDLSMSEACTVDFSCARDRNRRVVSQRELYPTDGNRFVDTDYSEFDGLGHYRKTVRNGFSESERMTFVQYNGVNGTYKLDDNGDRDWGYSTTGPDDAWLLNGYARSDVYENGATTSATACFDASTGLLTRKRVFAHVGDADHYPQPGPADLLSVFTRDSASGFVTREESYGGDYQSLGLGTLCTLSAPSAYGYRVDHTYQYGSLQTSRYARANGTSAPFYSTFNVIDRNTGAVRESRDVSDVAAVYKYDDMGRLVSVTPTGLASTAYTYEKATATSHARATQTTGTGTQSTSARYDFDALGRVFREHTLMPDGSWSARQKTFDTLGRLVTSSEPATFTTPTFAPAHLTTYGSYDAFGRVGLVIAPDATTTRIAYAGVRTVDRHIAEPGQPERWRGQEVTDREGRLVQVRQRPDARGDVTTKYRYNTLGRIASVIMTGPDGASQTRTFDFDGRGLLRWESQPESGMAAYTYDSRGHIRSKELGASRSQFDLRYAYDYAERLTSIEERNPFFGSAPSDTEFRLIKQYTFAEDNFSTNLRLGKLVSASRINYPLTNADPVLQVVQIYEYSDPAGRARKRQTQLVDLSASPPAIRRQFETTIDLDDMGNVENVAYPMCTGCGAPPANPARNLAPQYTHGRLTMIPGVTGQIEYWPNGMKHVTPHANGIADTQTVTNMARPSKLEVGEYDRCVRPAFDVQPSGGTVDGQGGALVISVQMAGTGPFTYQWWDDHGVIAGANGPSITVAPSQETMYDVTVSSPCGSVQSQTANVTVGTCALPTTGHIVVTRKPDGSYTLTPSPMLRRNGSPAPSFQWKRMSDNTIVGSTEVLTIASLSATTTYQLTITDSCGTGTPGSVTVEVVPVATTGLAATRSGSSIVVTWPAAPGAQSYELERRSGAAWAPLATVSGTSYTDSTVDANRTYAYRIASGEHYSNTDVATTRTFTAPQPNDEMYASYSADMLAAVNSVRSAVGWPSVTWANILSPSMPLVDPGTVITGGHIAACRGRMTEALQALGALIVPYTDPDLTIADIRAVHVAEVQERAK